jgi:type IV pilus assembly protein PilC
MEIKKTIDHLYRFSWKGISRKGLKVCGELQAINITEVTAELRKQGIRVTRIKKRSNPLFSFSKNINSIDITLFSRQVSTMLNAGIPLVQSLELIAKSNEKRAVRQLISSLSHDVSTGIAFSRVLRSHLKYFDHLYCDLVEVGEQSGRLGGIYERIANYQEKSEILKSKIKKAMLYPAAILLVATLVTLLLLLFVIPQFKAIYQGFGAELPTFTLFVLSVSDAVKHNWWLIITTIVIALFLFKRAHRNSQKLRDKMDKLVLKLPILGVILHKAAIARFTRTLSTTSAAGIPLIDALTSSASASGNAVYRSAVNTMRSEIMEGMQMHTAMKSIRLFPNMVSQMVMIGEESGNLDGMLSKVADIYEGQVDNAVDGLTSLLEPIIMVILGIVVGALIIAMYLPIFKLGSVIG